MRPGPLFCFARGGEPDFFILCNLARVAMDGGRYDEAMTLLGTAMQACRRVHDEFGLAVCLSLVGRYYWLRGQLAAALANGREALLRFRETDFLHFSLIGIFQQSLAIVDCEHWEMGATLLAATEGIGKPARKPDFRNHLDALEKIRGHVPVPAFERAWARGLAMGVEEAFGLALGAE